MEEKKKLEKGYTPQQVSDFWKEANAVGLKVRRTPDGGWEMYEPQPEQQPQEEKKQPVESRNRQTKPNPAGQNRIRQDKIESGRIRSNPVEKVESQQTPVETPEVEQPKKKGFWGRLFGKK